MKVELSFSFLDQRAKNVVTETVKHKNPAITSSTDNITITRKFLVMEQLILAISWLVTILELGK